MRRNGRIEKCFRKLNSESRLALHAKRLRKSLKKIASKVLLALLLTQALGSAFWSTKSFPSIVPNYSSGQGAKDVLIINDPHKYAFFGWFWASQMNVTGWELLNRTILWASSYTLPNETRIEFFSANPFESGLVFDWLVTSGYEPNNIVEHDASEAETLPPEYYNSSDLVIYWETYGFDSTSIVNSTIPFVTVSAMQTDEMGIGTGNTTMYSYNSTFHVVNNNYYPTDVYPLGPLHFESEIEFEATEATEEAKVLIKAEVESVCDHVDISMMQEVMVQPGGAANLSFTINVPDSPLADSVREAFFANASALEPEAEYTVPEDRAVEDTAEAEEGVKDITLPGDLSDGNGKCDIRDVAFIAAIFGVILGYGNYSAELDVNWDGKVDIYDVATAAKNFGKTRETTGNLYVIGYYNGTAVNCTEVYFQGPEGSPHINISASGHVWYNLLPGSYTVYGTYETIETSANAIVQAENVTYAQLDFGEAPPPPPQTSFESVRMLFDEGIIMEQLILLGFDINLTDSRIIPWGPNNETTVLMEAYSPSLAQPIAHPIWQITIAPQGENATEIAAEFTFSKIQYMKQLLQSLYGDQYYASSWQMRIELPPASELLNGPELEGLTWTIDFGGGTYMEANITAVGQSIIANETLFVTEQNITASEEYLAEAFATYKMFNITYTDFTPPPLTQPETCELEDDWSKTWTRSISPGSYVKTWSYGPLKATVKATPVLTAEWYVGWKKKWTWSGLKLKWFKTYIKVTPSIKVEASVTATATYSKTWSHTFWTWSRRFTFWVGPVPVWANLKLKVTGSVTISASGKVSVSTWAKAQAWFKGGVKWEGGWSTIWEHGWGASYSPPAVSGTASITVTPEAKCRVVFLFYDVAGPFVEAIPYAPISIKYYTYQANTWSISLKFKIVAGVTFSGWLRKIIKLSSYSRTLADWTLKSWSGTW